MRASRQLSVLLMLLLVVLLGGCDRAKQAWTSLRGEGDSAETGSAPDPAAELERERQLAERDRLEAERRERERLAAEALRQQLEQADALVASWADRLAANKAKDGAFVQHEGLTEDDPWSKPLRVQYQRDEDSDQQTMEVRSAGPNGSFDDDDDLVRTRVTQIERPWWDRNKLWVLGGVVWLGLGFVSAGGLRRRRHRKHGSEGEGLDGADIMMSLLHIVFAPLSMLFWLVVLIIEVIGEIAD